MYSSLRGSETLHFRLNYRGTKLGEEMRETNFLTLKIRFMSNLKSRDLSGVFVVSDEK